jgi:hypothetical protein
LLKSKQAYEFEIMRKQFHQTAEGLKPINLISSTLREAIKMPATGNKLVDNTLGIATGLITKKFLGTSSNPVKSGIGTLLEFGISNLVYKNAFAIKAIGGAIFQSIFSKRRKENPQLPETNKVL